MPYLNDKTSEALAGIIHYLNNKISETRLRERLKVLDSEAACSVTETETSLLHDVIHLASQEPTKCCTIINALQERMHAIDKKNPWGRKASAFLITHKNSDGLVPFYVAIDVDAGSEVMQQCSQWLDDCKKAGTISSNDYRNVHFSRNETASLDRFTRGGKALELQLCFEELNRAKNHKHMDSASFKKLIFSKNQFKDSVIDTALASGCPETIRVVVNNTQLNASRAVIMMMNAAKLPELQTFFHILIQPCRNNELSARLSSKFMPNIFLYDHHGYRVLDVAILPRVPTVFLKTILAAAKKAYRADLLTKTHYRDVLMAFDRPSPLHETLLTCDSERFSIYISAIIEAVKDGIISFPEIQALLLQPGKFPDRCDIGNSPMYQAISSGALEITELFFQVFKTFFPDPEYSYALHLSLLQMIPPHYENGTPEAIYVFVLLEYQRLAGMSESSNFSLLSRPLSNEYIALINNLRQLTHNMQRPEAIMVQNTGYLPMPLAHPGTLGLFHPGTTGYRLDNRCGVQEAVFFVPLPHY